MRNDVNQLIIENAEILVGLNIFRVHSLALTKCVHLEEIPPSLEIKALEIQKCKSITSIRSLQYLESLEVSSAKKLESIEDLPLLRLLKINNCENLRKKKLINLPLCKNWSLSSGELQVVNCPGYIK